MKHSASTTFFPHAEAGYLRISGADRIDFIQRQSTNDARKLSPGAVVTTVLTNPAARILDVLDLFQEDDEQIAALSLPGRAENTFQYLRRRIFFNDKVTVADVSPEHIQILLDGPDAAEWLAGLHFSPPEAGRHSSGQLGRIAVRALAQPGLSGTGFRLLAARSQAAELFELLTRNGAEQLEPQAYNVRRIEAGLPGADSELVDEFTPYETNLEPYVSATKGCYTGQEILARQLTYDKVTQRLVGLQLAAAVEPGTAVLAEGKRVGRVTSAAISEDLGPIALAVIKRPFNRPGRPVTVAASPNAYRATVRALPFGTRDGE